MTPHPPPAHEHVVVRRHVAVGGAFGALLRAGVVAGVAVFADDVEVAAILVVNLLGAFALGWLVARARRDPAWARLVPLLGTGLLGALTTWSALADQVARWLVAGEAARAIGLGVCSIAVGVAAAWLGVRLGARDGGVDEAAPGDLAGDRP